MTKTAITWNSILWGGVATVISLAGPPLMTAMGVQGSWQAALVVPLTMAGRWGYKYAESKL